MTYTFYTLYFYFLSFSRTAQGLKLHKACTSSIRKRITKLQNTARFMLNHNSIISVDALIRVYTELLQIDTVSQSLYCFKRLTSLAGGKVTPDQQLHMLNSLRLPQKQKDRIPQHLFLGFFLARSFFVRLKEIVMTKATPFFLRIRS